MPWLTLYIGLFSILLLKSLDWEHGDEAGFYLLFLILIIASLAGLISLFNKKTRENKLMMIPLLFHFLVIVYISSTIISLIV